MTIEELATALRCTTKHIHNLRHQGLPIVRVGRLVRFELRQVIEFLAARDQAPAGADRGETTEGQA